MALRPLARLLSRLILVTGLCSTATYVAASEPTAPTAAQKELMGYTEGAQIMTVAERVTPIDSRSNLIYAQIATPRQHDLLHMHLLIPRTESPKPAIIFFPGGGFTSSDYDRYTDMRYALAKAGFVVASAEYRVVPHMFPSLVEDGKAAVRYLRAHAQDFGIDPNKIGVLGDSAGGYMAQIVATTNREKEFNKGDFLDVSYDVQAAVSIYQLLPQNTTTSKREARRWWMNA